MICDCTSCLTATLLVILVAMPIQNNELSVYAREKRCTGWCSRSFRWRLDGKRCWRHGWSSCISRTCMKYITITICIPSNEWQITIPYEVFAGWSHITEIIWLGTNSSWPRCRGTSSRVRHVVLASAVLAPNEQKKLSETWRDMLSHFLRTVLRNCTERCSELTRVGRIWLSSLLLQYWYRWLIATICQPGRFLSTFSLPRANFSHQQCIDGLGKHPLMVHWTHFTGNVCWFNCL